MKNTGWLIVISIVFFFSGNCATTAQRRDDKHKPNIIVIYTDDQRFDATGFNGNTVIHTPAIDKLASQAMIFTHANVIFSLCSPSRAALLTGRYGSANGVLELGSALNPGEKTVAQYLKQSGYITAISGKWHIKPAPDKLGFDFHVYFWANGAYYHRTIYDMGKTVNPAEHCDEYCVDRSIDFLKKAAKENKPFFLFQCPQLPHMNNKLIWNAKLSTLKKYRAEDMPVPKNRFDNLTDKPPYLLSVRNRIQAFKYGYPEKEAIQEHTREYYSVITEMDDAVGRLLKTVRGLGLYRNTYIIFMSDNGWMLGEHGFTSKVLPYRPSARVPLFIAGPGISHQIRSQIVLNIDLAPTILDLADHKIPENMHGKSLMPLLFDKQVDWRKAFVYEGLGTYGGSKPNLAVYNDTFRYIITYDDKSLHSVNYKELYDEKNDPGEMQNLMNNPDYADIVRGLQKYIDRFVNIMYPGERSTAKSQ